MAHVADKNVDSEKIAVGVYGRGLAENGVLRSIRARGSSFTMV